MSSAMFRSTETPSSLTPGSSFYDKDSSYSITEPQQDQFIALNPQLQADKIYYSNIMETQRQIWLKGAPTLLTIGIVGNILSIMVLSRSNMMRSNTAIYLIVLSVSDILVLCTGLLRQWLRYLNEGKDLADIRHSSPTVCKIHLWLTYSTLDMSQWVIVALTVERFISVYWPHRIRRYCTTLSSLVALATIGTVLLIINSHFLYGFGDLEIQLNSGMNQTYTMLRRCAPLWDEYALWQQRVWPWVDLCLYSLIPLSLIIAFNISIVAKVIYSGRPGRAVGPMIAHAAQSTSESRSKQLSSMTTILVVLTLMCLVCTMPISAYLIAMSYSPENKPFRVAAHFNLAWAIVNMLAYASNSVNFILYCMSGTRFRTELLSLCRKPTRVVPLPWQRGRSNGTLTTEADATTRGRSGGSRCFRRPVHPLQDQQELRQRHQVRQQTKTPETRIEDEEFIHRLQNPRQQNLNISHTQHQNAHQPRQSETQA